MKASNENMQVKGQQPNPKHRDRQWEAISVRVMHMNFSKKRRLITLIPLFSGCPCVASCWVSMLCKVDRFIVRWLSFPENKGLAWARCAVMPLSFAKLQLYSHSAYIYYSSSANSTSTDCCKDNTCRCTCAHMHTKCKRVNQEKWQFKKDGNAHINPSSITPNDATIAHAEHTHSVLA